jgi:hypothetical protein
MSRGVYKQSDGQERQGFRASEADRVQDLLFDVLENTRYALDYIDGPESKVDSIEFDLLLAKNRLDVALALVQRVMRIGERKAN